MDRRDWAVRVEEDMFDGLGQSPQGYVNLNRVDVVERENLALCSWPCPF